MAFYEPCFGKEVEWITLDALERIRRRERSTYLRLTNKRIDQSLFRLPADADERERLRRQTLAGAYRLVDRRGEAGYAPGENVVQIMACGAMLPEAIEAGELALREGIYANVVNLTGPGAALHALSGRRAGDGERGARRAVYVGHLVRRRAQGAGDNGYGRASACARVARRGVGNAGYPAGRDRIWAIGELP